MGRTKAEITKTDGYAQGKSVSQEQSVVMRIKGMVKTDAKVYYIIWRFSPHLLPKNDIKTFDDLKNSYKTFTAGMTETFCENWLTEENVQTAVKWLLNRLHQKKMIELYNIYFEKAKEDTTAFKAFIEFSEKFFAEEKDSELLSILNGMKDDDLD